ncbi:MAG: dihydrolipoyl dehydrogenase [Candidatus Helarchaeales archaeon]
MKPKEYDLIAIGTGSAMMIVEAYLENFPDKKVAVIDKDEPGGICLTKACIPTKMLVHVADLVRTVERAKDFGINVSINGIDFKSVMNWMRSHVRSEIEMIRHGLKSAKNIDYYDQVAEFVDPYTLKVGKDTIKSSLILLCTGSKPLIPKIKGIESVHYHTSDTILNIEELPESIAIVGGSYIAAEFGHFFSSMGSEVTIIGRNPKFLPQEEPEIGELAKKEMQRYMKIVTNHEVIKIREKKDGTKEITARNRDTDKNEVFHAKEVLIASGRSSNSDILHPEKSGIEIDKKGWIKVNEYLETTQPGIWALGDAVGIHLFKHVANMEAKVVFYNAILKEKLKVDYHAVPHAVFACPEIASVGMREEEAIKVHGKDSILIGFHKYENTAKGEAMKLHDYFVKVIINEKTREILGAHIIGPQASVLIQEIVNLMYTKDRTIEPIHDGMHIHPALSEVVERAFFSLMPVDLYHHVLTHHHHAH